MTVPPVRVMNSPLASTEPVAKVVPDSKTLPPAIFATPVSERAAPCTPLVVNIVLAPKTEPLISIEPLSMVALPVTLTPPEAAILLPCNTEPADIEEPLPRNEPLPMVATPLVAPESTPSTEFPWRIVPELKEPAPAAKSVPAFTVMLP